MPNFKIDAVLLLWSGISDYSKKEQLKLFKKIASLLDKEGLFILETIDHNLTPSNVTNFEKQTYTVNSAFGNAYGYVPSPKEIKNYANKTGLKLIKQISYETITNRKRVLYILKV